MNRKRCQNCGAPLPPESTRRRKFCNAKCRVEFNRRGGIQANYNQAIAAVGNLGRNGVGQRTKAVETLRLIRKEIDFQLRVLGDADTLEKYQMFEQRRNKGE